MIGNPKILGEEKIWIDLHLELIVFRGAIINFILLIVLGWRAKNKKDITFIVASYDLISSIGGVFNIVLTIGLVLSVVNG